MASFLVKLLRSGLPDTFESDVDPFLYSLLAIVCKRVVDLDTSVERIRYALGVAGDVKPGCWFFAYVDHSTLFSEECLCRFAAGIVLHGAPFSDTLILCPDQEARRRAVYLLHDLCMDDRAGLVSNGVNVRSPGRHSSIRVECVDDQDPEYDTVDVVVVPDVLRIGYDAIWDAVVSRGGGDCVCIGAVVPRDLGDHQGLMNTMKCIEGRVNCLTLGN